MAALHSDPERTVPDCFQHVMRGSPGVQAREESHLGGSLLLLDVFLDDRKLAAACVLVTGLVWCVALLISQTRAAVVQRSADIPGRPLDGGQAANDRNDRAVLADSLASFREVPRIFSGLVTSIDPILPYRRTSLKTASESPRGLNFFS